MGIGEILDVAIKIYRRNAWTLFRIVLVVIAPITILANIVFVSAVPAHPTTRIETINNRLFVVSTYTRAQWHTLLVGFAVGVMLTVIGYLIATGAAYKAVAEAFLGDRPDWKRSLALRRETRALAALGEHSRRLPRGSRNHPLLHPRPVSRRCVRRGDSRGDDRGHPRPQGARPLPPPRQGSLVADVRAAQLGAILSIVLFYAAVLLARVAISAGPRTVVGVIVNTVTSTVLSAITIPFAAAYVTVLYFDLRVRREAFDLQLLALEVGVDGPAQGEHPPTV